jgi:ribonuclease J
MEKKKIGDFSVTHILQDHSVPGASSYILESNGKKILYSGDIRFHGTNPLTIDDYAKKVGSRIDLMLCEGTRIDSDKMLTESGIIESVYSKIKNIKGVVFVDFSWKDTTRFHTILSACKKAGRIFVINSRLAYILDKLGEYPSDKDVKVFVKRKGSCLYSPTDYSKYRHEYGLKVDWDAGIDSTHYENGVVASDIKKHPEKYVMMLSYFDLSQIFDIADEDGKIPDSFMIRAQCAPFCDDLELDEERFINWLEEFGIGFELDDSPMPDGCMNPECQKIKRVMKRDHVSGHVSRPEIKELIKKINPKVVMPIHTVKPEEFNKILDDMGKGIELILPEYGVLYNI